MYLLIIFNMHRLFYLPLVICATFVYSQSTNKTIPLNKTLTYNDKVLYEDYIYLSNTTITINFIDVSKKLDYIIFQVHSHLYNVKLSQKSFVSSDQVQGTDIGLCSSTKYGLGSFTIENKNQFEIKLFIAVHGYADTDPIPGGGNLVYPRVSPNMKSVVVSKSYVTVEAPWPDWPRKIMSNSYFEIVFYMKYLPENNFDADTYFEAIRSMSTIENIERLGTVLPEPVHRFWHMRRSIAAYPGTGAIYVAVVKMNGTNSYAIYTPTHDYSCSPLLEYDCELIDDDLSMLLNALLLFIGLFICFFGHRFFKIQIFTIGFLSGFVLTYILLSLIFGIDGPGLVAASAMSGLCIGAIRVVAWWLYGIPIYVIVMTSADIGFLAASFLYYVSPGGWSYLQVDSNFWSHFILIMLIITMCLLTMTYVANLICCAVIGAYTAIYPMDYYFGSNLKFILNNTIRRATVVDFNKAVINPPWQWPDILLFITWIILSGAGFFYQYIYNKGRSPFPPPPRSFRVVPELPARTEMPRPSLIERYLYSRNRSRDMGERRPLLS